MQYLLKSSVNKIALLTSISLVLLFALAILGSSLLNTKIEYITDSTNRDKVAVLGKDDISDRIQINHNNKNYIVNLFKADTSSLELIANFTEKEAGSELSKDYGCKSAINAGFYNIDNTPLGLFIADSEELFAYKRNSIMNGILSINRFDTPRITRTTPEDPLVNAVQTGPFLIENDEELEVTITSDKNARRSLAFVDGNNNLYFAVIYDQTSGFIGPRLDELPAIVTKLESELGINIADAINLDGGSASFFSSNKQTLTEISPIGALFCQK